MKKKQFKAESRKLLNLMINSIYTNKDIFLRELISNSSDAIDKLYFNSLTNKKLKIDKDKLEIDIKIDKEGRKLIISDNGCGMSKEELENNLGTIAESGSMLFKSENKNENIDIIGQFGVGFYSVFMVASNVDVISKKYDSDETNIWSSSGEDGYTITEGKKDTIGTDIIITLKEDDEEYEYSKYLNEYEIEELIKKYSNYIHYPIKLEKDKKLEVMNSITPIWKKDKSSIKDEEYNEFYKSAFNDYEDPLEVINYSAEGTSNFKALLFIPKHAPFNLYSKDYKKGLQLYSSGVLIMDKCENLVSDEFSFVKGLVDSEDVSLNISRELLQQDKQVSIIAKNIEKKITKELSNMLENDRDKYNEFYKEFGTQMKISLYNSFGANKDTLEDLLMFYSSKEDKLVTLKEYLDNMSESQDKIYYAVGESIDKIKLLPQVDEVLEKGYEVLYLTDYADEFVIQVLRDYKEKEFVNVSNADLSVLTDEEKKEIEKINEDNKDLLNKLSELLKDNVSKVKFTNSLKNHPVCLTTEGNISTGMEKILNSMPTNEKITSSKVLSININHPIADKLKYLYENDLKAFEDYSKILYAQSRLIEGLSIDNANEISDLICNLLSK